MPAAALPFIIGGIAAGAGAIGSAAIQSNAAGNAAQTEQQTANQSLDFQKQQWEQQQANEAPWLAAGKDALGQLSAGLAPGGSLVAPFPDKFTAPTGVDETNDPGFQFRLQQGQQALERAASASGTTGGGELKAAQQYGQGLASNEYQNVYNRALQGFDTNYGVFENNQANQYSRLAALAGLGQQTAGQLGQQGSAAASGVAGTYGNLGNNVANLQVGQGNAAGAGLVGATNSITSGIGNYQNNQILQQILAAQTQSGYDPIANAPARPYQVN